VKKVSPDVNELPGRDTPLAMASGGTPLVENAAGKKDDDYANQRHAVIVPSIGRRSFDVVDIEEFDGAALGLEPEPELLLHRCKNRR